MPTASRPWADRVNELASEPVSPHPGDASDEGSEAMESLVLGPVLRHVGETTAAVWVQLDRAATVTVTCRAADRLSRSPAQPESGLGCSARTFEVHGHHYALVTVTGLEPDTTYPYEVAVDGDLVWPPPVSPFPPSALRTRG